MQTQTRGIVNLLSRSIKHANLPCRQYTNSVLLRALVIEKVPVLGESITEGSISQWTKQVGEAVAVDECVVIIETDKVSVDIKSTIDGILSRQIGGDGDVAVGDDLFEIDTEGVASVASSTPAAAPTPAVVAVSSAPAASKPGARVPLIKFLGKRSLIKAAPKVAKTNDSPRQIVMEGNGEDFRSMEGGAWFGRPALSEEEIEAIESGGATEIEVGRNFDRN